MIADDSRLGLALFTAPERHSCAAVAPEIAAIMSSIDPQEQA